MSSRFLCMHNQVRKRLYHMPGNQSNKLFLCQTPYFIGARVYIFVTCHTTVVSILKHRIPFTSANSVTKQFTIMQMCFYILAPRPDNSHNCRSHSKTVRYAKYFSITSLSFHISSIERSVGNLCHLEQHFPPLKTQANTGALVAQWVMRWPTDLADRVRSLSEAKSSQP